MRNNPALLRLIHSRESGTNEARVNPSPTRSFRHRTRHKRAQRDVAAYGLFARISGEGLGASNCLGLTKPASRNQLLISAKVKVSPSSVFTSMLTAKINALAGPVRSSFGTNSAIAMVPPGARAANVLRNT